MRTRFKFGVIVLAVATCAAVPGHVSAQKAHPDRPPQSHPAPAPAPAHPQNQNHNADRPPANPNHPPANQNNHAPQSHVAPQANYNNAYRPNGGANLNPRQQLGVGAARPWVDTMRDLSPAQRERVLQNSRAFQNLSPDKQNRIRQQFNQWDHMTPQQRQDLRSKEAIWTHLTPEQRDHIKNDVLPKWRQMPWDRQQVLKQKLGVLQNMPESARNQRLDDPNFTRGMSDDEKSMLHDLSHTHVGAPDTPNE
ncbi:MAG: DUF3106 domain-containing protein [Candidatus Acidiferrum sp.]